MATASGEVQTNEEAQVYVYDLDLFVTLQLLEDTPAVLSLGKLCEAHGYTYEWASGQKPHQTEQGKKILCKTENFILLVVPGGRQFFVSARLLHRHHRTHQVHLQVQSSNRAK